MPTTTITTATTSTTKASSTSTSTTISTTATMVTMLPVSKPITIPGQTDTELSYREIIKQLAAQTTTKPYEKQGITAESRSKPMRRMSHVEDWIQVDSKESLPDEEELVQSPFRNFLSADFFTEVLPLHMPPPSLSEKYIEEQVQVQQLDDMMDDSDEEEEDDDEDEEDDEEEDSYLKKKTNSSKFLHHKDLLRRHSVSSFTQKSSPVSSTTTASYAISSSPPHLSNTDHELWKATLAKLKQSLLLVSPSSSPPPPVQKKQETDALVKTKKRINKLIPMPIPPRRPLSQKRRSEATTQPRFNPDTNTYTRDTRSNPDHLRMISAELNMMRGRKLLSPLKPRGFLPRRKDPFIRGGHRKPSHLMQEIIF
ncbi:uncharacterized protein B0P05DRAFT_555378 [Gilbertella persicaria]|uniref:uncharacterized protein n=1 Tax=Gilbertella persicaria TaxID=101096 RepID=UPI00221E564F|nr:uncharacterized protein B0P05DRAFT_555378 [Gilbertella persicaria]KAI8063707.1 hypothetical protein B0P05DRAFT_555378 [Gilbertella persicaria]